MQCHLPLICVSGRDNINLKVHLGIHPTRTLRTPITQEGLMDYLAIAENLIHDERMKMTPWDVRTLAIWLRDECKCVYCQRDMLESFDTTYYAWSFEHLLPRSKYPELDHASWNMMLACRACNGLKHEWDPNTPDSNTAPLYVKGSQPTEEERSVLIERAKTHVSEKRRIREALFPTERKLILQKLQSLA